MIIGLAFIVCGDRRTGLRAQQQQKEWKDARRGRRI